MKDVPGEDDGATCRTSSLGGVDRVQFSHCAVIWTVHLQNSETNATIFNVALPFRGFSATKPLPSMPMMLKVKCDAHEWMRAWIMELDHPGPIRSRCGTRPRGRSPFRSWWPQVKP